MFKLGHSSLVIISGALWFVVGGALLVLGLSLLSGILEPQFFLSTNRAPIVDLFSASIGREAVVLGLIVAAILIGNFKGRFVLSKAANRGLERIRSLPNPSNIVKIYDKKYYLLLASMVLIGMVVKFFPHDIRGFIDVAIGTALINGSLHYFRGVRA